MARKPKAAIVAQETTPAPAEIVQRLADATRLPDDGHRPDPAFNATDHGPGATDPRTQKLLRDAGFQVGDAAEPTAAADTSFTPHEHQPAGRKPHMVWARIDGSRDKPIGIKLETEQERKPGTLHQRVLIRFRDDCLPTPEEKARLKDEGFKFCPDVQSWGMQKSAANQVLALRTVNDLLKLRGHTGQGLYV